MMQILGLRTVYFGCITKMFVQCLDPQFSHQVLPISLVREMFDSARENLGQISEMNGMNFSRGLPLYFFTRTDVIWLKNIDTAH